MKNQKGKVFRSEGRLPFASVMEESLYGEGGYYNREELAIGTTGDFVTGSSLTPLFGRLTARLVERLDGALGKPATFLEAGYGLRTTDDARVGEGGDYTLQEARAQLRLSSYGDRGEVFLRLDMLHDGVADWLCGSAG